MSIPAARVGTRDPAPDPHHRPCDRCGLARVTSAARDHNLCASCIETCTELDELEVWR